MTDKVAKAETSKNAAGIPTVKVSSGRSVFFYVDLATKFLKDGPEIELSGLGYAITTAVTIAEILKNQGVCVIKKINTNMTSIRDRRAQKPKIEVLLARSPNFDEVSKKKTALAEESRKLKEELQAAQEKLQEEWKNAQAVL